MIYNRFSRSDTRVIKGFAVVMMMLLHMAGLTERLPVFFDGWKSVIPGFVEKEYLLKFARCGDFCVSLFFFLGGYGLWKQMESTEGFSLWKTIWGLYRRFWKVFVIFIPLAFWIVPGNEGVLPQYRARYIFKSGQELLSAVISNFSAYSSSFSDEWWFLGSYLCVLPMGYLFVRALRKNTGFWKDLFIVFGIDILVRSVFPGLTLLPGLEFMGWNVFYRRFLMIDPRAVVFFLGIVFAKHDAVARIKSRLWGRIYFGTEKDATFRRSILVIVLSLFLLCIYWSRVFIYGDGLDIVYTALFIPALSLLFDLLPHIRKVFLFLGKHSTNMWLTHSFYTYYFPGMMRIVYCTNNVWIDLLILVLLSLGTSIILEKIYRKIDIFNR